MCHRCHTCGTPLHAGALQGGTSRQSRAPVAGRAERARRPADPAGAQAPSSPRSLGQAPVRPPRENCPLRAAAWGVLPVRALSCPLGPTRHPHPACTHPLYHMYPSAPQIPLHIPELPYPLGSHPALPLRVFFSPGAEIPHRAPYISLWTAAVSPPPGPSETSTSHSEPRSPFISTGRV